MGSTRGGAMAGAGAVGRGSDGGRDSDDRRGDPDRRRTSAWVLRAAEPFWLTRWVVLLLLALDAVRYGAFRGAAPWYVLAGLGVIGLGVVGNLVLRSRWRRDAPAEDARVLGVWALAMDLVLVTVFVVLYLPVADSGYHLLYFLVVAEAAALLGLWWGLLTWGVAATTLVLSETFTSAMLGVDGRYDLLRYRVIGLLIVTLATGLLSERLREQQRLLSESLEATERELRWRRGLIDMLAHDLRSPLGTAASSAELLATRATQLTPAQVVSLSDATRRQIGRSLRLLDDLLDLGRARSGVLELHPEPVDLDVFVTETLAELPERFSTNTTVEVAAGASGRGALVAEADPARLAQVLWNLLTNAEKHGRPPVTVRVRSEGGEVLLEVLDDGDGVDDELRELMFEPFLGGGGTGSTGLGLWISRLLVDAQGGRLAYGREDGRTRFSVYLPSARVARQARVDRASSHGVSGGTPAADRQARPVRAAPGSGDRDLSGAPRAD